MSWGSSPSADVDTISPSNLSRSLVVYTGFNLDVYSSNDPSVSCLVDDLSCAFDPPHSSMHVKLPLFEKESDDMHDFVVLMII